MIDTLYKEEILEHFHDPQNFGELDSFSKKAQLTNPFCGDDVTMFVKLEKERVEKIGFTGKGCAISVAGASILTEQVKGKKVTDIEKMTEGEMLELLGVAISETRKKCALLALSALQDAIK